MNTEEKICCKCKISKSLDGFSNHKKRGKHNYCKSCMSEYQKEYAKTYNKTDAYTEKKNRARKRGKEKYNQLKKVGQTYYQKNRGAVLARQKEYTKDPKVKENRRKVLREWTRKRCAEDPAFRVRRTIATRIWHALKGTCKSKRTRELLGCHQDDFKIYIEKLFLTGMSWENYGNWHVDHIIPCDSFDLSTEENQRKCFHYKNLQPLWAADNLSKGCKIILPTPQSCEALSQ
jgi:hypothetical protein